MANGPALSTARSGEVYQTSPLSLLDVLYANQFEGKVIDPEVVKQAEENFYRGAPPNWLNFYISEKAESDGTGTPFIKRDGYDKLVGQIQKQREFRGISTVKLFHQPGCGGTTLAMKVLWDLRKSFRSAVLTGSTSDITNVAEEVVHLFTAGSRGHQNTVLLLVNDEESLENLQDNILEKITEQQIDTRMPVVIFLNCVRKDALLQNRDNVVLQKQLSDTEKQKFDEKNKELCRKYSDKCNQFHGFNIMQTNFSLAYVEQICKVFSTVQRANKQKKAQLAAFISLLNAYVPGSYLLESQCLDFFKHDDYIHGDFSLEDRMEPFSHLIITFQEASGKKVCMAHPMIAQCCTELMVEADVARSDTARNLLTTLCRDEVPAFFVGFVKDMLTKRRPKPQETEEENQINSTEMKEEQERFSRLILDIQRMENDVQSASVLKMASNKFGQNPFFPQALARFYYTELKDYNQAEMWAKTAKQRDPKNSFIADTLGQVYKNNLKNIEHSANPREIFQLAAKAIEAFKDEEQLAENERGRDMKGDGKTKVSHVFNTRGMFGYLQVCNLVYDLLVKQNETWRGVLTKKVSLGSVLGSLGDNKLFRFNALINSLRDEVERKCAFFDTYLTYSKPDMKKDDRSYISRDTSDCYRKYVGDSPPKHFKEKGAILIQKLKQNLVDTSARVLSCLDRECTESHLKEITTWWEEIFLQSDSVSALANYILAHIMLRNMGAMFPSDCNYLTVFKQKMPLIPKDSPELHMLTLLLCWPTNSKEKCVLDLNKLIQSMHCSYEHAYEIHFRSRYLPPLFFIGKGQDLTRIVHRKVLKEMVLEQNDETIQDWNNNWSNEKIFEDPKVQARLLKVEGVVRNYRVYATIGGTVIEMDANLRNRLWKTRQVSFYIGVNIRGPVAFAIQTKPAKKDMASSEPKEIKPQLSPWMDNNGGHFVDLHQTALINRVTDTEGILLKLKDRRLISNENYEAVRALKSTQDQMSGILQSLTSNTMGKDALYEILKRMKSMRPLINELEGSD
ncbi:sterile alpha motif domain-containing protein 9-like isoform X2 [Sander lucioperca]|uniref:sterile alpha motif domain-containing protein 9-like isoform X2 n=1 Tax=Sander lucioperca TaxID=283035 RepID=UPI00125CD87B|nr:sterile alpha motif domain-containing protein 9-like isoform X2 [Sander lucioperca]